EGSPIKEVPNSKISPPSDSNKENLKNSETPPVQTKPPTQSVIRPTQNVVPVITPKSQPIAQPPVTTPKPQPITPSASISTSCPSPAPQVAIPNTASSTRKNVDEKQLTREQKQKFNQSITQARKLEAEHCFLEAMEKYRLASKIYFPESLERKIQR